MKCLSLMTITLAQTGYISAHGTCTLHLPGFPRATKCYWCRIEVSPWVLATYCAYPPWKEEFGKLLQFCRNRPCIEPAQTSQAMGSGSFIAQPAGQPTSSIIYMSSPPLEANPTNSPSSSMMTRGVRDPKRVSLAIPRLGRKSSSTFSCASNQVARCSSSLNPNPLRPASSTSRDAVQSL